LTSIIVTGWQRRLVASCLMAALAIPLFGCNNESGTTIQEDPPKSPKLVVQEQGQRNCTSNTIEKTFIVKRAISSETSWSVDGRAGIGGKVPLGWFLPELDIEAEMTTKYGQRTTESWEETSSDKYPIKPNTQVSYVVIWQEEHRTGEISFAGKTISYDYPQRLKVISTSWHELPCNPAPVVTATCIELFNGPTPTVDPKIDSFVKKWRRASPDDGDIIGIDVTRTGRDLTFHVFADCQSSSCDWGEATQCYQGSPFTVSYDLRYKVSTLSASVQGARLHVEVLDHYTQAAANVSDRKTVYEFEASNP
jgi:hypothetical protein